MRRAVLALLGVMLALRAGHADGDAPAAKPSYRVVVDRVDHEPASIGGTRLSITMSAMTLQGSLIDLTDPKDIKIKTVLGSSELKAPYSLGTYAGTKDAIALVIVVQSTTDYTEVMPAIAETLEGSLLSALDDKTTQVAILPFGESVGTGKLTSLKTARAKALALSPDGTDGDPAMLATIERALALLKRAKTEPEGQPLRKMIVLISDGRGTTDREAVTRLGTRASKEGVRIHSFGFSSTDLRRPMLNLGELSKRSFGTFRWVQREKADSWAPAFEHLRDEINKQYVLTYFLSADEDPTGKRVHVQTVGRIETTSNDMKVPAAMCNGETCDGYCTGKLCAVPQPAGGRGVLGWLLLVGGIALGAILVLGGIGFVLSKRTAAGPKAPKPPMPGVAPGVVPATHVAPPPPAVVTSGPSLMILSGPRTGERLGLRHGFTIGKAPGSDLLIDDGFTSGTHAQIGMDGGGNCWLIDQGSTNGTFVNGVRIQQSVLEHGHSIKIGSTDLRFLAQ